MPLFSKTGAWRFGQGHFHSNLLSTRSKGPFRFKGKGRKPHLLRGGSGKSFTASFCPPRMWTMVAPGASSFITADCKAPGNEIREMARLMVLANEILLADGETWRHTCSCPSLLPFPLLLQPQYSSSLAPLCSPPYFETSTRDDRNRKRRKRQRKEKNRS